MHNVMRNLKTILILLPSSEEIITNFVNFNSHLLFIYLFMDIKFLYVIESAQLQLILYFNNLPDD